jgi:hypothetical protein
MGCYGDSFTLLFYVMYEITYLFIFVVKLKILLLVSKFA